MKKTIHAKIAFLLAFLIVGVMSCKKDEIEPKPDPILPEAALVKVLFTDPADGATGVEYTAGNVVMYETEDQVVVLALRSPLEPTQLEVLIGSTVKETITSFTANADETEYTSASYSSTIAALELNYGGGVVITLRSTFPAGEGTATLNNDFSLKWGEFSSDKTGVELFKNGEVINLSVTPMDADGEDPSATPVDFGVYGVGYNFPDRYTNHYLTIDDLDIGGGVGVLDFMYTENFTVSMWVNLVGAFGDPHLFSNQNFSDQNDGFLDADGNPTPGFNYSTGFSMLTGGGNWTTYFSVRELQSDPPEPGVNYIKEKSVNVGLEDTGWHLWTVTIDRAGKAVLYTDGIEATTSTQGGVDITGILGSIDSGLPWNIAQDGTGIQQTYKTDRDDNFLEGNVASVKIFDYALNADEVAALAGTSAGEEDPAYEITLKTETSLTELDYSLHGDDVALFPRDRDHRGFRFDDRLVNGYVTIEDNGALDFMYTEDFSVSMYVNLKGAFGDPHLFSNQNFSDANDGFLDEDGNPTDGFNFSRGFSMLTGGGNYTSYLSIRDASTPSEAGVSHIKEKTGNVGLEDTGWHLWTVTVDRSGNAILYVDGVDYMQDYPDGGGVDISGVLGSLDSGLPWNIAQDGTGIQQAYKTDRDDNFLEGKITNIVIYDYVVSPGEVADIYTALQ